MQWWTVIGSHSRLFYGVRIFLNDVRPPWWVFGQETYQAVLIDIFDGK